MARKIVAANDAGRKAVLKARARKSRRRATKRSPLVDSMMSGAMLGMATGAFSHILKNSKLMPQPVHTPLQRKLFILTHKLEYIRDRVNSARSFIAVDERECAPDMPAFKIKDFVELDAMLRDIHATAGDLQQISYQLEAIADEGEAKPEKCKACGKGAVSWNPFNKVTQCHACGEVVGEGPNVPEAISVEANES